MLQIAYPIMISEMKTKMFLNEKRIRNISLFTDAYKHNSHAQTKIGAGLISLFTHNNFKNATGAPQFVIIFWLPVKF